MTSTVTFPRTAAESGSIVSVVSRHATALEVCDLVYGNSESAASLDAVERFYEPNASECLLRCLHCLMANAIAQCKS
jgi:hypothetical protein